MFCSEPLFVDMTSNLCKRLQLRFKKESKFMIDICPLPESIGISFRNSIFVFFIQNDTLI